jgi:hypothetical protein
MGFCAYREGIVRLVPQPEIFQGIMEVCVRGVPPSAPGCPLQIATDYWPITGFPWRCTIFRATRAQHDESCFVRGIRGDGNCALPSASVPHLRSVWDRTVVPLSNVAEKPGTGFPNYGFYLATLATAFLSIWVPRLFSRQILSNADGDGNDIPRSHAEA